MLAPLIASACCLCRGAAVRPGIWLGNGYVWSWGGGSSVFSPACVGSWKWAGLVRWLCSPGCAGAAVSMGQWQEWVGFSASQAV